VTVRGVGFRFEPRVGSGAQAAHGTARYAGTMQIGDVIEDFELPDENGDYRRLSDFLAEGPVVLFFYPRP